MLPQYPEKLASQIPYMASKGPSSQTSDPKSGTDKTRPELTEHLSTVALPGSFVHKY